eukprot:gb/GFBE01044552.1/.p1 GENE.gb/GFBE01044552.1/~~gb/GFBE01044552.1/.p1  ORF type:complete len:143 (+),score=12.17 gb/GFBE01044552.1/:1-429(+)
MHRTLYERYAAFEAAAEAIMAPTNMWIVKGSPVVSAWEYAYHPLDIFCGYHSPDLVVLDSSSRTNMELEWFTIETVCKPQYVALVQINHHLGSTSWIHARLEILDSWQLVVRGHYSLGSRHRGTTASEMRRIIAWSVFTRVE